MIRCHDISDVKVTATELQLSIDGKVKSFPLSDVSKLAAEASDAKRQLVEISPSGYGLHWPLLDEDISIDGLLRIQHQPSDRQRSA